MVHRSDTNNKHSRQEKPSQADHQEIEDTDEDAIIANNAEDQIDHQLAAIRVANDLMKSTLRSSREILEKSQENGFDQGYDDGYQVGYETGFQEGLAKGKKQADQEAETKFDEIRILAQTIENERDQAVFQREDEIISFAMEIAKKIMRYEIKKDEAVFAQIFHEVIHKDDEGVKIYLSEHQKTLDLCLQKSTIETIKKLSKKMKIVLLKEDDKIVVETDQAVIDMAVPVQLGQIKKAIEDS